MIDSRRVAGSSQSRDGDGLRVAVAAAVAARAAAGTPAQAPAAIPAIKARRSMLGLMTPTPHTCTGGRDTGNPPLRLAVPGADPYAGCMRNASRAAWAASLAGAAAWAAGSVIAAAPAPATVTPPPYTAEEESLYDARYRQLQQSFFSGLGAETYDPLEAVPGARRYRALPDAGPSQRRIDPAALEAARAYAERNRSSALLVWRDGRLEQSAYFGGAAAPDVVASKSLAKPMTAIAVGRAIALGRIRSLDQPVADFVT